LNYDIYRFDKVDSTNSHLLKLGVEGFPEGTVVVADEQTAGRGRFGRNWEAEPQVNVLSSLLVRPNFLQGDEIFVLTFAAAVSVAEAIEDVTSIRCGLKWPNDVLLDNKKVCGILLESSFDSNRLSHVVLGIGLNVNQQSFSPAISSGATSLRLFTGKKFDRDELLFAILTNFSSSYESLRRRDFYSVMKKWRDRSVMFGKNVAVSLAGKTIEGVYDDVADDGALVLRTDDGLKKFTAGDVTII
jgi:BirA family transcriptional regulator, biotin operon repressor / biotin---[acetyl-CoA-carboxylase] ligase